MAVNILNSYVRTAVEQNRNIESILAIMNITKLVVKKGLKNISHYSYDLHMFTAIIHHFEGLFGSNNLDRPAPS